MKYVRKSFTFDGKRYFVRGKTEEEAIVKREKVLRDLQEGKRLKKNALTVQKWAEQCVEIYKTNQKEVTRKSYESRLRSCIYPYIGDMPLQYVKPMHCQQVLNHQEGNSRAQIKEVNQILNFIFNKAVDNKLVLENPAKHLTLPAGYKHARRALTASEERAFLSCIEDPKYLVFALIYHLGLRPSEARSLRRSDLTRIENTPAFKVCGTKTDNAERTIPIPDALLPLLPSDRSFAPVATYKDGPVSDANFRTLWKHLQTDLNIALGARADPRSGQLVPPLPLAEDLVPYCLRHTYCTNLAKRGVDIRTAQYLMGHSDITLTANIYTHVDQSALQKAADLINGSASRESDPETPKKNFSKKKKIG